MAITFPGGGNYIVLPVDLCAGWTAFSLSLWTSPSDVSADQSLFTSYSHNDPSAVYLRRDLLGGADRYLVSFADAAGDSIVAALSTGSACGVDETDHIVITFDADNEVRAFINGVEDANSPFACPTVSDIRTEAGSRNYYIGNSKRIIGHVWEFAIWEAVLTPADIALLYSGGQAVHRMPSAVSSPPDSYWPMIDGTDGSAVAAVRDHTGNGNDGTITGALAWAAWNVSILGAGPLFVGAEAAVVVATFGRRGIRTGGELVGAGIMSGGRM